MEQPRPTPTETQPPDTRVVRLPGSAPQPATRSKPHPAPAPPPTPISPEPAPGAAPQLGQLLSLDEQQRYDRLTRRALARTRAFLRELQGRRLTADQKASLDRILAFVQQAEELRSRDLVQASSLAERAAVLARELAASVR